MTVTLELPSEIETEVSEKAAQKGLAVPDYLLTLVKEDIAPDGEDVSEEQRVKNKAALAHLRSRRREDATDDSQELERRNQEWEELKTALNESHTSNRVLFP